MIFTDSDLPYGTDPIFKIYDCIKNQAFEIAVGDRSHPESTLALPTPLVRKLASRIFCVISNFVFGISIKDTQCGLKGFRGSVAKKIFPIIKDNRFGGDLELLYLANKYKIKIASVPVHLTSIGKSSVNVFTDGFGILFRTLSTILLWTIGKYPKSL